MGMAQKTGMDRSAGDPDVWIGLDHLRFGMDHRVWIACGTGVWIGTLHFEPQPYIYIYICIHVYTLDPSRILKKRICSEAEGCTMVCPFPPSRSGPSD